MTAEITAPTDEQMEAVARLYHTVAFRQALTFKHVDIETMDFTFWTQAEAEAHADEETEKFRARLISRAGLADPYLLLGLDLIEDRAR